MQKPVCVIVGAGPGNGAAFARRFAGDGYRVAVLARDEGRLRRLASEIPGCVAIGCDVTVRSSIDAAFDRVARELGPVSVLVYNAGNYASGGVSTDVADLEKALRINVTGCLLAVQHVAKEMRAAGGGAIVIIGATASRRGAAGTLPFATAKSGQRAMAESLARELWPAGIHVAYVVLDAVVDALLMRALFACRPAAAFARPDDIAITVAHLASQSRTAWTFEVDLRPHVEKW